jgi:hypothetical protein
MRANRNREAKPSIHNRTAVNITTKKHPMKYPILVLTAALGVVAPLGFCQEEKTTMTDVQTAFDLYKKRTAEGSHPSLIIKDGQVTLTEKTILYQQTPGEFTAYLPGYTPTPKPLQLAETKALIEQVESLKKLVAELEKQLAACKPNP